MNMPLAGSLNQSARHYVEKIGALYERARSLVTRRLHNDRRLQVWEWHRASAQACVEEASLIYADGLEALLKEAVTVTYLKGPGAPRFDCRIEAVPESRFRVCGGVLMETPQERESVERLFGGTDAEVLEAFAEGLCKLQRLGGFKRQRSVTLQPGLKIAPETAVPTVAPEPAPPESPSGLHNGA